MLSSLAPFIIQIVFLWFLMGPVLLSLYIMGITFDSARG
jgi:hypothetical protein